MIIDRLYESVEKKGPVCIGLDTVMEYIPKRFFDKYIFEEDALFRFNQRIIDATFDTAACYKLQIACYEALGIKGLKIYKRTLEYIKSIGGISIGDIKRGDIANTAEMYAKAHFAGDFECDFVTLSPYMGMDSTGPFMKYVNSGEKGLFVLMRTSNPGAKDIQYIEDGKGRKVYETVAEKIEMAGSQSIGACGYSSVGAVVGCTHVEEGKQIRERFNKMFFLIPGYGAQGGTAQDVALYLNNGNGGIVNSSRGVILAYKGQEGREEEFDLCAREEVLDIRRDINEYKLSVNQGS